MFADHSRPTRGEGGRQETWGPDCSCRSRQHMINDRKIGHCAHLLVLGPDPGSAPMFAKMLVCGVGIFPFVCSMLGQLGGTQDRGWLKTSNNSLPSLKRPYTNRIYFSDLFHPLHPIICGNIFYPKI